MYSSLLVAVLALMGFGIWFVLSPKDKIEMPEGEPMVLIDINIPERRTLSQLSIYENGTVIFVEDSDIEMPMQQGDDYIRTWRTGKVDSGDLDYFFSYLDSIDFYEIETTFISPDAYEGIPDDRGASHVVPGGLIDYVRIFADNNQTENAIEAIGYISNNTDPGAELPYPVNFIYAELVDIIENNTEEVMVEELIK